LFIIIFIDMKILITENKLISVYQKFIDRCLSNIKLMDEGDVEWEDWVDREVLDNINVVESIKVNDVEKIVKNHYGITIIIFEIHVSTLLDSHKYFDCFQIYYNIEHYLKRTIFGKSRDFKVKIIEDNIEMKNKDPQW
jgi:hypothetical protein